ncbi:MAG: sigma 54-interacting transcriptional regulator [Phycisphaerae bacterium]|nr:sigma 54-interacting transcriptional regulator [Phycisphaerae bacterium]
MRDSSEMMDILAEVIRMLSASLDLTMAFPEAMEVLNRRLKVLRAALVLRDERKDRLTTQSSWNMTTEQIHRGQYQMGEGIIGSVVTTGKSRTIPDIANSPEFLNRTGGRRLDGPPIAYVCHPIILAGQVIGALSVDLPFASPEQLADDARLLRIVSDTIGQSIHIHRLVAQEKQHLLEENLQLRASLTTRYRFDNLVGRSAAMDTVFATVAQVSVTRATVLITGETGTGKELIAKAIHFNSPRKDRPFIRVNCGAVAESLLESEMFGHVEGAFTGATRDRVGHFEAANGGTIFLDEIHYLEPRLQVKLLRVLQERELQRVGSSESTPVDVRVLAAASVDLDAQVKAGKFREELFYRLNVVHIHLPPLRSRREDIPRLIDHFLDRYNAENGKELTQISPAMLDVLLRYPWPGNVRELENAIERAVVMSQGRELVADLLPLTIRNWAAQNGPTQAAAEVMHGDATRLAERLVRQVASDPGGTSDALWDRAVGAVERALIEHALAECEGVKLTAAERLGINRNTLNAKIKKLGLE